MKTKNDPFFNSVERLLGPAFLEKAGWLDHPVEPGFKDFSYCNLNKVKISKDKLNFILFNTGAYHPAHEGHIRILEDSKEFLENKGFHVSAGFLCPSHNSYTDVKIKNKNINPGLNSLRIYHLNNLLCHNNWISSDLWQAHQQSEVNFTDTYRYFENLFKTHLKVENTEIAYVFGSDNAYFSYAFLEQGYCVCVLRPGHEDKFYEMKEKFEKTGRHFFVNGSGLALSSTSLGNLLAEPSTSRQGVYHVRDDSFLFENLYSKDSLLKFKKEFISILKDSVPSCQGVELLDAREQRKIANTLFKDQSCINLDFLSKDLVEGTKSRNWSVCRVFSLNDSQIRPFKLEKRPEDTYQFKIPPGKYVLVDDDIASGYTVSKVSADLSKNNVEILTAVSLLEKASKGKKDLFDVVDLRDFMPLIAGKGQGLVVENECMQLQRISYLDPRINLFSRASIPFKNHQEFRAAVAQSFNLLKRLK